MHPHTPLRAGLQRRRLLLAAATGCLAGWAHASGFREISWDELVPRGWDPMKSFKDVGRLSDNDPRTAKIYEELRRVWDNAPTVPELAGARVRLPGYLVPLDEAKDGIREFLLVPYFGACIHTPPPPANQIVLVQSQAPLKGFQTMDAIWASGTLSLVRSQSGMGSSGYTMVLSRAEAYKAK